MTKPRTKKQRFDDYYKAFKCVEKGVDVKRYRAQDGSIPTHPVVELAAPDLPEAEVLKACMKWLKYHHIFNNRLNNGTFRHDGSWYTYGIKSGGDIIGVMPNGKHLEIECKKAKGGRLSKGQQKRMREVRGTNGLYFVVHGVEEMELYLGKLI